MTEEELEKATNDIIINYLESSSPLEWHKTAMDWNWDNDLTVLWWIINNPKTDKATALMIYWMSAPRWGKQYANRQEIAENASWYLNHFDFIEDLESKYTSGFYTNQNYAYNPAKDFNGTDWTNEYTDKPQLREISAELLVELKGEEIKYPDNYIEGVPENIFNEISELIDQYDEDEDDE